MQFLLTTDTSCDWPKSKLREFGIPYIPLTYTIGADVCPDEFDGDDEYRGFYDKIRQGAMPSTSQINPAQHFDFFTGLIEGGAKAIVHLTLSAGLSATYESACSAAKDIREKYPDCEIHIINTVSATLAHGYLLEKGRGLRDNCVSAEAAAKRLNEIKGNLQAWVIADDLMHLKRGGRVSAAAAIVGTVLGIKPILILNRAGGLSVVHKCKGTKKALQYLLDKLEENCEDFMSADIFLASGDCEDKISQLVKLLRAKGCKGKINIGWIGPIIGTHTGPGTLGMVFEGKERTQ